MKYILIVILVIITTIILLGCKLYFDGDVNGDGKISISDYTLVRLHCEGIKSLTEEQIEYADVNNDGKIDYKDYDIIRDIILS